MAQQPGWVQGCGFSGSLLTRHCSPMMVWHCHSSKVIGNLIPENMMVALNYLKCIYLATNTFAATFSLLAACSPGISAPGGCLSTPCLVIVKVSFMTQKRENAKRPCSYSPEEPTFFFERQGGSIAILEGLGLVGTTHSLKLLANAS